MEDARTFHWRNHRLRVRDGDFACFDVELVGEPELGVFEHGGYAWKVSPPWLARIAPDSDAMIDLQENLMYAMFAGI